MKSANPFMKWGAQLIFERPVKNLSLGDLSAQLDESGKLLTERLKQYTDLPANRYQLCHLIGIERWGQRRLRVAIGEPFLAEEYGHYRPSNDRPWDELVAEWDHTRRTTIALVKELAERNAPVETKIEHNQYGPLSVKAWLRYLDAHASSEGKQLV